jgi:membrane protein YfhO
VILAAGYCSGGKSRSTHGLLRGHEQRSLVELPPKEPIALNAGPVSTPHAVTSSLEEGRYLWLVAALAIAVVIMIGNLDLVRGKSAPIWDAIDYYAPMFSLVADHAKAGKLLLWDPWINGGSPDFADPQSGANSPIILLLGFLSHDPFKAFVAYWIGFWIFGGLGMLCVLRHLRCPIWGAFIVSLGFVSCGFYTGHGEHTSCLYSFSFLPWIVWRFDLALERKSYWNMVETGVLWGVSALGGYPAVVILDPIFLMLWALGRIWFARAEFGGISSEPLGRRLIFFVLGLCLMGVVGTAVTSPAYLSFILDTKGYTFRSSSLDRHRAVAEGPLPPAAIGTLASPYLYLLNLSPYRIWPETDISLSNIYTGVLVVSLAFAALQLLLRWRLWLAFITAFFLACAVGPHLPLRGWLYDFVLPTRYFRFPSLFSAYAIFGICILAALATIDLERLRKAGISAGRRRFFLVSAVLTIAASLCYCLILRSAHLTFQGAGRSSRLLLLLWLSALATFFLWWRRDISDRLFVTLLVAIAIYDAGSTLAISQQTMYSPYTVGWWKIMSSQHVRSLDLTPYGLDRHLFPPAELGDFYQHDRNVAIKQATLANDTGMVNQYFQPYIADPVLHQLAVGEQRIWFSDRPEYLPLNDKAFTAYMKESHALGLPTLALHSRSEMVGPSSQTTANLSGSEQGPAYSPKSLLPASVELLRYYPNGLEFRYRAAQNGWLLLTDRWAKDWKADVNGRPVEVLGANFLFRAIPITRGDNLVQFRYTPPGYMGLITLSWGVILLVGAADILRTTPFVKGPANTAALRAPRSCGDTSMID